VAPLALSPVFAGEYELLQRSGEPWLIARASRAVRNRTLPRLPADGEAWVRQGLGLADERGGEQPEALWRGGLEVRVHSRGASLFSGVDLLVDTRGLGGSESDLLLLGTDGQDHLPGDVQRERRSFLSPWSRVELCLPLGLRGAAAGWGTLAQGGTRSQLGLPAVRWNAELSRRVALFKGDLGLDLALAARGQTGVSTPYGDLPSQASMDGLLRARVGEADLFFVFANLTDQQNSSMAWDGGFIPLPRRHYRAGLRWCFLD